jgi:hypothetical protein
VDELKKLNRSIFRPAITFNKDAKYAAQEAKVAARYDEERSNRERAIGGVRESQNRLGQVVSYGTRRGEKAANLVKRVSVDVASALLKRNAAEGLDCTWNYFGLRKTQVKELAAVQG